MPEKKGLVFSSGDTDTQSIPQQTIPEGTTELIFAKDVITRSFSNTPAKCNVKIVTLDNSLVWSPKRSQERLVIGRSDTCNIIIKNDIASRIHGYFTIIDRGCVYFDQSSNGSYMLMKGMLTKLFKSGTMIDGSGTIFIGVNPNDGTPDRSLVVEFDIFGR